jgi:hypothetical protein
MAASLSDAMSARRMSSAKASPPPASTTAMAIGTLIVDHATPEPSGPRVVTAISGGPSAPSAATAATAMP